MIVAFEEIPKESVEALVEAFVLREGTDYGAQEISLAEKVQEVIVALQNKQAFVVYSEETESFDILSGEQVDLK